MKLYQVMRYLTRNNIKPMVFKALVLVLIVLNPKIIHAQPRKINDSLITTKKTFNKNEKIQFAVKLNKYFQKNTGNKRLVETMSCACSNKDFYYELYSINNIKFPNKRKEYLMHNEKPDDERCERKSQYAVLEENKTYYIPAINQNGKYVLIIRGNGFIMYSNIFEIID